MKLHFEIVFALLSYFGVCLLILGWIWLCIRMARKAAGDNPPPDRNDGGRPPRPRRPMPPSSGDRVASCSNGKRNRRKRPLPKPARRSS